jgi:hypothetical protein
MPWAAGTFGRLYGSAGWVDDRDAGTKILATRHDAHDQDLSDGINACLKKDGTNAATADLNAGGFKITNAADPTSAQDVATKAYVDGAGSIAFASGDQIVFRGASTPTGWTIAAQNNKALRIVSGTPSSGGTNAFTTALNSARTTSAGGAHKHGVGTLAGSFTTSRTAGVGSAVWALADTSQAVTITGDTANESTHTHTLNLDVQYYDMQVIQKT